MIRATSVSGDAGCIYFFDSIFFFELSQDFVVLSGSRCYSLPESLTSKGRFESMILNGPHHTEKEREELSTVVLLFFLLSLYNATDHQSFPFKSSDPTPAILFHLPTPVFMCVCLQFLYIQLIESVLVEYRQWVRGGRTLKCRRNIFYYCENLRAIDRSSGKSASLCRSLSNETISSKTCKSCLSFSLEHYRLFLFP